MRPVISGHYKRFDVARGLAAIVVLVTHVVVIYVARVTGSERPLFYGAEIFARHAVLVFFLLSGYLITVSILLNIKRNGRFDGVHYLTSRIARIYPPLCGAMLIIMAAWVVIHAFGLPGAVQYGLPTDKYIEADSFSVSGVDFLRALLMQDGLLTADSPLWSLYAEFHIYLLAMLGAMSYCARGSVRYVWFGLGLVLFAIWSYLWVWFIFYALIWALGALVAIANSRQERVRANTRVSASAAIASTIAIAIWFAVAQDHDAFVVNRPPLLPGFVVQALCSVCYAYLLFNSNLLNRVLPQALATTGDFSYSLYVIHYPLLLLGLSLTQNWMGDSMGRTLAVSIVVIPVILFFSKWFARYFEDQKRFSGAIRSLLVGLRSGLSKGSATAVERR